MTGRRMMRLRSRSSDSAMECEHRWKRPPGSGSIGIRGAFQAGGVADDVDQPFRGVQAAPQIVVLAMAATEEGAEMVELDALEGRGGPAGADRLRVLRADPIDADRVELSQIAPMGDGEGQHIPEGEPHIGGQ
jgi:hypothetical protein